MNNRANGRKVNEETFHKIIEANPRLIPFFEGKEFLGHEFSVYKKSIDFVLKDPAYYYLVEMKYRQDPIAAIIDLDKKAPLFARQERVDFEHIKEVILVDRQSYEDKKQDLEYHRDKGVICLDYDPGELLGGKGLSLKEQALGIYETYFFKPLERIREEILRIESGEAYVGPGRTYSSPKSYANFLTSRMRNLSNIWSVLAHQLTFEVNLGDISRARERFSAVTSTAKELLREYKVVARCEPSQGFGTSRSCFLDAILFAINQLVGQAAELEQRIKDRDLTEFKFTFTGDAWQAFTRAFEQDRKQYESEYMRQRLGCAGLVLLGITATLTLLLVLALFLR